MTEIVVTLRLEPTPALLGALQAIAAALSLHPAAGAMPAAAAPSVAAAAGEAPPVTGDGLASRASQTLPAAAVPLPPPPVFSGKGDAAANGAGGEQSWRTAARAAVLRVDYPANLEIPLIREKLNTLPGPTVTTRHDINNWAFQLGLRRPGKVRSIQGDTAEPARPSPLQTAAPKQPAAAPPFVPPPIDGAGDREAASAAPENPAPASRAADVPLAKDPVARQPVATDPAPRDPASEIPAPEIPAREIRAPAHPGPAHPAPETPAREIPAPESLIRENPAVAPATAGPATAGPATAGAAAPPRHAAVAVSASTWTEARIALLRRDFPHAESEDLLARLNALPGAAISALWMQNYAAGVLKLRRGGAAPSPAAATRPAPQSGLRRADRGTIETFIANKGWHFDRFDLDLINARCRSVGLSGFELVTPPPRRLPADPGIRS